MLLTLVPDPLRRSVGNPHADCSKTSLELSFRPDALAVALAETMAESGALRHRQHYGSRPCLGSGWKGRIHRVPGRSRGGFTSKIHSLGIRGLSAQLEATVI